MSRRENAYGTAICLEPFAAGKLQEGMCMSEIMGLLCEKRYSRIRELLCSYNVIDIARELYKMPSDKLALVFRLLPKELAAQVFVEMEAELQISLIRNFSDAELHDVFSELYADDTVDIIEELPANVVERVLLSTDPEKRRVINELLSYPEHSAGSIMTVEFIALKSAMSIREAMEHIRRTGIDKETIYTCYVTDKAKKLVGVVTVKDMIFAEDGAAVGQIMNERVICASTRDDREEVVSLFREYGLMALPVVDTERRLVGIVTYDDALDVIVEENSEDVQVMAAITPSDRPYLRTGVFSLWLNRIPWLLLMMLSATFTGMIITGFESALAAQVSLTAFIPMLMSTGGNTGSQASTTVIRGLSMGEVGSGDTFRVMWKELRVGVLCAVTLACANFIKIALFDTYILRTQGLDLGVNAVVCITLALTVITAKLVGCTLPILARRIGFDPAVMAAPFITTILDAVSLLIYFAFARAILGL